MPSIEFGLRDVANDVRDRVGPYLKDSDSRRTKTIELRADTPDSLVQRVREEAADSREVEANKAGQIALTDAERRRIDFSKPDVNVPKARSIKGIARAEGVDDWISKADFQLTVDENRSVLERAGRSGGGRSGIGRSQERANLQQGARQKRQRRDQAEGAKDAAFRGDTEAIGFLDEERAFEDDLFDISLRSAGGPSGRDYERLEAAHEDRPERAQAIDERRTAEVTRDPLEWAAAPDRHDFPGIDTVEPAELHAERSERARRQDELDSAPIADTREQWARAPDQFDWPGVDTPSGPSINEIEETASTFRTERERPVPEAEQGGLPGVGDDRALGGSGLAPSDFSEEFAGESMFGGGEGGDFLAGGREADIAFLDAEADRGDGLF